MPGFLLLGLAIVMGCSAPTATAPSSPAAPAPAGGSGGAPNVQDATTIQAVQGYKVCPNQPDTLGVAASTTFRVLSYQEGATSVTGRSADTVQVSTSYTQGSARKTTTFNYNTSTGMVTGGDPLAQSILTALSGECGAPSSQT